MRITIPRAAVTPLVTTVLWLVYTVIETLQDAAEPEAHMVPGLWVLVIVEALVFWVPLTLVFLAFARRVPLTEGFWPRGLVKLVAATAAAIVCRALWIWFIQPVYDGIYPGPPHPMPSFLTHIARGFYMYHIRVLMVIAFCYAWVHLRRMHENRIHIAELETRETHARLDALSAQLNPHFLFNTLNSIAELIHIDAEAADRMLMTLCALLRFNLSSTGHEITIENETALVAQYLSIEKIRLGERLDVRWSVEADVAQALVPALILQPLAENAIVHGIARRRAPGAVQIAIRRAGDTLVMEVGNDGGAADVRSNTAPRRSGLGLANIRARLECLYGERSALTLRTLGDGRHVARIELPLRFAAAANDQAGGEPGAGAAAAASS